MQIGALIAGKSMLRSLTCLAPRNASTVVPSERLWRSFLYVPGDQERKIKKMENLCSTAQVSSSIPDFIVLDCEDAVSAENKVGFLEPFTCCWMDVSQRNLCVQVLFISRHSFLLHLCISAQKDVSVLVAQVDARKGSRS